MFDEKGKPIMESPGEATMQMMGFRPERISMMAKTHREFANVESHFAEERNGIYAEFRLAKTDADRKEVITDAQKYNLEVSKYRGAIPLINAESLRKAVREKPPKKYLRWGQVEGTPTP
jgi:hypothetical protein